MSAGVAMFPHDFFIQTRDAAPLKPWATYSDMTPIEPSDDKAVAHAAARPDAADLGRADGRATGVTSPQIVASVWNEAYALYLALRREYAATGPEIANFDNAWNVWTANPPDFTDSEALAYAHRALLFYEKAAFRVSGPAPNGSERLAFAHRALTPYWEFGADLARLAETIEATRPATPQRPSDAPAEVPIGTEDELKTHLDTVEASLAKISAGLAALRKTVAP